MRVRAVIVGSALLATTLVTAAHAQTRDCLSSNAKRAYSATDMTATWVVDAGPCTTGHSAAAIEIHVTVERCVADQCSETSATDRCLLKAGRCIVKVALAHPPAEAAEYRFAWSGSALSRGEVTGRSAATASATANPCLSAVVVVRDCTNPSHPPG